MHIQQVEVSAGEALFEVRISPTLLKGCEHQAPCRIWSKQEDALAKHMWAVLRDNQLSRFQ